MLFILNKNNNNVDNKQYIIKYKRNIKIDIEGSNAARSETNIFYSNKALKTTENDVNKFDEEFKRFNLTQIHKDLKKLLGDFN